MIMLLENARMGDMGVASMSPLAIDSMNNKN